MSTNHSYLRRSALRRTTSLALAVAIVPALAACGSDDADVVTSVDATEVENVVSSVVEEVDQASEDLAQALRDNGLENIAGLVEQVDVAELTGDEDFTFFAPNDDAFTTLGADEAADLLSDPGQILDVLRNHLLAGTITAEELANLDEVETEAGEQLPVTVDGDVVRVGDVTVVTADIDVAGGVVHVVDGLLLP